MIEITVTKNDSGQRADKFLKKAFPDLPVSLLYKTFRKKDVKANGKWIKENVFLSEGDVLSVYLPDDLFAPKTFKPVEGDITIIYEDENIAVIDKDKGVPCQDGAGLSAPLCDIFKTYLYNRKEYEPTREHSFAPALCNRIDTNTEGLVIGAKNAAALRDMNEAIRGRRVKKFYLCETEGLPPKNEDTVRLRLKKDGSLNKSFVSEEGVLTETHYRVLERRGQNAICEIELLTGKSHQIRAVMAHLGCPLVGDTKYGARGSSGQHLIAYKIGFDISTPLLSYLNGKFFYSKHTI